MGNSIFIDTISLAGSSKGGKWSDSLVSPSESKRNQRFGQLFVVISLGAPSNFNSKVAGDLLCETIQDIYYEDHKEDNVITRLERAILATAKRLEFLLQREKIAAEQGIDLNIEAVVIFKDFVYMAILGEGSIMLSRDKTLINLTEGLKDLTGRNLIRNGSGKWQVDDKFILISPIAAIDLSEREVKRSIKSFSFEGLDDKKKEPLLGLLMLKLLEQDETKKVSVKGGQSYKEKSKVEVDGSGEEMDVDNEKYYGDSTTVSAGRQGSLQAGSTPEVRQAGRDPSADSASSLQASSLQAGSLQADSVGLGQDQENDSEDKNKFNDLKDKIKDKLSDKATYQVILLRVKEFGIKVYKFSKTYIWEGFLGMGKGGRLFIRGAGPRKPIRGIIILIVLAVVLLYFSIKGIQQHSERSDNKAEIRQILSEIDEKFDNGRNLGSAGSIVEAVLILEEAINQLAKIEEYGFFLEEIKEKEEEGIAILDEVRRVLKLADDNMITDIAGYIEGASADDFALWQSKIYISDVNSSAIYEVSSDGGEVNRITDENSPLAAPNSIVFDKEGNLLINDLEKGILKFEIDTRNINALAGLSATSVGEVQALENYTTPEGNDILYLLRPGNNDVRRIIKYPSGYSLPELRLADTKISDAKDIEIDGKIYIFTSSEGVLRYYLSNNDGYTIVGLDKPVNNASCIELDDNFVFVGDSVNKRIVVLTKGDYLAPNQGRYVAQILYRGDRDCLGNIHEIIVDNDTRVLFILDGTKIFRIGLDKVDEYAESLK